MYYFSPKVIEMILSPPRFYLLYSSVFNISGQFIFTFQKYGSKACMCLYIFYSFLAYAYLMAKICNGQFDGIENK